MTSDSLARSNHPEDLPLLVEWAHRAAKGDPARYEALCRSVVESVDWTADTCPGHPTRGSWSWLLESQAKRVLTPRGFWRPSW